MRKLSIVIPCFNEQETIQTIIGQVLAVSILGWSVEIIVVDDGSSDNTVRILKNFGDKIKLIVQSKNEGKGSAVRKGLESVSGDFVIIQDADLEYSPKEIPLLVAKIQDENSVVYGSRNINGAVRRGFIISRFGVWLMTVLVNLLYGSHLTDIWTCYKLFPAKVKNLFKPGKFDSEVVFTLDILRAGMKIEEVPISHNPRDVAHGKKIRYRDGVYALYLIFKHRLFGK
jgi:glycosyltransferase involved in cell wall biosynthesis